MTCAVLPLLLNAFPAGFAATFGAQTFGFNPRLGFAWDPLGDGRTSVRAGLGMYTAQFPAIIVDESRSIFPSFLTLNFSSPYTENLPQTLLNPANPSNPFIAPGLIQSGTLNQIPSSGSGANATQNAVQFVALRLAGSGFGQPAGPDQTLQLPSLQFTQPGAGLQNGYSIQAALTVERAIGLNDAVSLAYVGTLGRHLLRVVTPVSGPCPGGVPVPGSLPHHSIVRPTRWFPAAGSN